MRHWAAIGAALATLAATLRGADASAAQKGALVVTGGAEHMCTLSATVKKIKRDALATRGRLPRAAESGDEGARSGTSRTDIELALANATQLAAHKAPGTGGKLTRAQSLRAALRALASATERHDTMDALAQLVEARAETLYRPIADTIEAFETASTNDSDDKWCLIESSSKSDRGSATRADQAKLYGCIREDDSQNKDKLDHAISLIKEREPIAALRSATHAMQGWRGEGHGTGADVFDAGTSSAGVCTFTEKGTSSDGAGLKANVHTPFAGLWTLTLNGNNPTIAWKGGDLTHSAEGTEFEGIIEAWDALQANATIESQMCDTSTFTKDVQLIMDKLCSDEEEEGKRKHIAALVQLAAKVTQQAAEESENQTPQQSGENKGHKTPGHEDEEEQRATEDTNKEKGAQKGTQGTDKSAQAHLRGALFVALTAALAKKAA
ncbi:hypothetical protein ERJ75_001202800 [Trypanosoma vivax]|nr:hypothetical protein ERJ75_001202800 [Trypanosoma vivax]